MDSMTLAQHAPRAVVHMQQLHRQHDGVIVFHRRNRSGKGNPFPEVAAIRADELAQFFPEYVEELAEDSFYTINGFAPPWDGWTPGRGGIRKADRARWLTAAYADLDHHKRGVQFPDALRAVTAAHERGKIPPPSIIANSGRGSWLFWVLQGEDGPGVPVLATRETTAEYLRILRGIHARVAEVLPQLEVDQGANDLARLTRIPFSYNNGTGYYGPRGRVRYHILAGAGMRPFVYTLAELRDAFRLPPARPPERFQPTRTKTTGTAPKRVNGRLARWAQVVEDLDRLAVARGGIQQGGRSHAVLLYAYHRRRCSEPWPDVEREAYRWAKSRCCPPLSDSEIRDALKGARGLKGPMPYRTAATKLNVAQAEADTLELQALRPDAPEWKDRPQPRKEAAAIRREALARIVATTEGAELSVRGLRDALRADGVTGSLDTILRDLAAIGHETPDQRRDRELREAEQRQQRLPSP